MISRQGFGITVQRCASADDVAEAFYGFCFGNHVSPQFAPGGISAFAQSNGALLGPFCNLFYVALRQAVSVAGAGGIGCLRINGLSVGFGLGDAVGHKFNEFLVVVRDDFHESVFKRLKG